MGWWGWGVVLVGGAWVCEGVVGCSRRGGIFGRFGRFAGLSGEWRGIGGLVWVSQGGAGGGEGAGELRGVGGGFVALQWGCHGGLSL